MYSRAGSFGGAETPHQRVAEAVNACPLFDHHCHPILNNGSTHAVPFISCFSEASGEALSDVPHVLAFKRSLWELAALLGCGPSLDNIERQRATMGPEEVARLCFKKSNIEAVLLDDGIRIAQGHNLDMDWHRNHIKVVRRVLRIETVAEDILQTLLAAQSTVTIDEFDAHFLSQIDPLPEDVAAFKSVAAYRSGLAIDPFPDNEEVAAGANDGNVHIQDKALVDHIFLLALMVSVKHGIPMQLHTGFGDKDLDLLLANPLHLRPVLEDPRFLQACLVLLHAGYPYVRESGYLCSVYKQVIVDAGLAIPLLSVAGMRRVLQELLELAPTNKLLLSTDGHFFPESFYMGAIWARAALLRVLYEACDDGDLTEEQAAEVGVAMLCGNARRIYGRPGQLSPAGEVKDDDLVAICYGSSPPAERESPRPRDLRLLTRISSASHKLPRQRSGNITPRGSAPAPTSSNVRTVANG
eukprot:jgi/Chlat1/8359/Chrsp80S07787